MAQTKNSKKPNIAEKKVKQELEEKMTQIHKGEVEKEAKQKAQGMGVPYINLKGFAISPEALKLVPKEIAQKSKAVCFLYSGPEIRLAATDPLNAEVKELLFQLEERYHAHGEIYFITEQSFEHAFKLYDALPVPRKIIKGVEITEADLARFQEKIKSFKDLRAEINRVSTTEIVALMIAVGLKMQASDIHVEAEEKDIKVRLRIDGLLQDAAKIDQARWKQLISRIKLVAGLKINKIGRAHV